jgi:hypothetical protein
MRFAKTYKELYANGTIIKVYKDNNAISSYYTCLSYNKIPINSNTNIVFQGVNEIVLCMSEQWVIYDPSNEGRNKTILSYVLLVKKEDKFRVVDTYFLCGKTLKNYVSKKYCVTF